MRAMWLAISVSGLLAGDVAIQGTVRTRVENWDWFSSGDGDGTYAFSGTAAKLSLSQKRWQIELMAPVLLGLPEDAQGAGAAGALGLGSNYYTANNRKRNAAMLFLKQANFRIGGFKIGRFEFNDGTEVVPKDATLAALKRERIAQRLIGNFVWTHVQRSLDGFHFATNRRTSVHWVTAAPTRGVFQVDGWGPLRTAFSYLSVNRSEGRADWRLFGIYYHDWRQVLKVDNRSVAARRADTGNIRIGTYGGHYLYTANGADLLVWGAAQGGRWGNLTHRAGAFALEAGYQPKAVPKLRPWIRGGYYFGSGDGNPADGNHGTFFQLLPTPRPFARFPFFNMMNNQDVHGSLAIRPSKAVTLKFELHALRLASGSDLWFQGGGAFQPWTFGYAGRPSGTVGGTPGLANLVDISADWNVSPTTVLSFYFGHAHGLRVIESIYAKSSHGNFGYVELMRRF